MIDDSMLFNNETTTRSDYRRTEFTPPIKTEYKESPKRKPHPHTPVKHLGTMTDWKKYLPFDALYTPKEILQTNPSTPQEAFDKDEFLDSELKESQRTRPRLVMPPWVAIDDITDDEKRNLIVKDMYTTIAREKAAEALCQTKYCNVKAPLPNSYTRANAIPWPRLKPSVVPREWRMESLSWDRRQLRSNVDATQVFWLQPENAPKSCEACKETKMVADDRGRRRQLMQ